MSTMRERHLIPSLEHVGHILYFDGSQKGPLNLQDKICDVGLQDLSILSLRAMQKGGASHGHGEQGESSHAGPSRIRTLPVSDPLQTWGRLGHTLLQNPIETGQRQSGRTLLQNSNPQSTTSESIYHDILRMSLEDDGFEPCHIQEPLTNHSNRLWSGHVDLQHPVSTARYPVSNPTHDEPGVHTQAAEALGTVHAQVHALVAKRNHAHIQGPFGPKHRGDAFPFEDHIRQLNQITQLVSGVKCHAIDEITAQREMLLATIQEERTQLFLDKQQWLAQREPIPDNKARTYDVKAAPITHLDPLITGSLFMVVILHLLSHLAIKSCSFILKVQKTQLYSAFSRIYPRGIPENILCSLKDFPETVATLPKWLPVSSEFTMYAACPTCSFLYAPVNRKYPALCTYDEFVNHKQKRREEEEGHKVN
ncbi:hypothetical protein K439DRAFT_1615431 [Ramaria rubella]|nr:hypothetical protein K439DRAFT_1615431 [Ramaria rubella]